jgi:hypothetical protein
MLQGMSAFSQAAYGLISFLVHRPSLFFRVPVVHAFLNGLVRGFWRMACRDVKKNSKLSQGQEAIVSKAAQVRIAANVRRMCPTSEFDSAFKNIIECECLPTMLLVCPATPID